MLRKKEIIRRLEQVEVKQDVSPEVLSLAAGIAPYKHEAECARFLQRCINRGDVKLIPRE